MIIGLVTAKICDWLSHSETLSRPCRHVARQRIIRLKNESVTRGRTRIKGKIIEIRSASRIPGKNLRRPRNKTRKQSRTRLQLPHRGTNCAAGWEKRSWLFVLHAKSIWTNKSFPPPALRTLIFARVLQVTVRTSVATNRKCRSMGFSFTILAWSIDYSTGINQSHLSLTRMDQSQLTLNQTNRWWNWPYPWYKNIKYDVCS